MIETLNTTRCWFMSRCDEMIIATLLTQFDACGFKTLIEPVLRLNG